MARHAGPAVVDRRQVAGSTNAQLGRIRLSTALGCAALTGVVVLARGGARHRRLVFRHHEHRVIAAMNTWTAVSRSLGLAALILVAGTLAIGLLFGRHLVSANRRAAIRAMHMTISLSALTVIALHILTLLGASALGARLDRLLIPWLWPYRRTATALGVLSIYVLALLGPTYYARRAIGMQRWRVAHRFIASGLALAILHVVGGG
jgi:predicted ferric reductase